MGVRISKIEGFLFEGSKYDGIEIQVVADPRDVAKQGFKLSMNKEKPGTELLLVTPMQEAGLWHGKTDYTDVLEHPSTNYGGRNQQVLDDSEAIAASGCLQETCP